MAVIHISEAEAARDFASLLARVRGGAEIVIEDGVSAAPVRIAADRPVRRLSESLRLAKEHSSKVTLDDGFANDLKAVIDSHPEALKNQWD
jgi:antitoxin (DNA-binding transcriptional repressor) of toxin-antitoxin stability system